MLHANESNEILDVELVGDDAMLVRFKEGESTVSLRVALGKLAADRERKFLSGFALGKFSFIEARVQSVFNSANNSFNISVAASFGSHALHRSQLSFPLTGSRIFAMQCPMCLKMKCKRDWRPCQWKAETPVAGPFSGCRERDMSEQGIMEARANVVPSNKPLSRGV